MDYSNKLQKKKKINESMKYFGGQLGKIAYRCGKKVYLIVLMTFQCFQNMLRFKMFPVWDILLGIFDRKAKLDISYLLSTFICMYLYDK